MAEEVNRNGRSWTRSKRISLSCLDWRSADRDSETMPFPPKQTQNGSNVQVYNNHEVACFHETDVKHSVYQNSRNKPRSPADALLRKLRLRSSTSKQCKTVEDVPKRGEPIAMRSSSAPRSVPMSPVSELWDDSGNFGHQESNFCNESRGASVSVLSVKSAPGLHLNEQEPEGTSSLTKEQQIFGSQEANIFQGMMTLNKFHSSPDFQCGIAPLHCVARQYPLQQFEVVNPCGQSVFYMANEHPNVPTHTFVMQSAHPIPPHSYYPPMRAIPYATPARKYQPCSRNAQQQQQQQFRAYAPVQRQYNSTYCLWTGYPSARPLSKSDVDLEKWCQRCNGATPPPCAVAGVDPTLHRDCTSQVIPNDSTLHNVQQANGHGVQQMSSSLKFWLHANRALENSAKGSTQRLELFDNNPSVDPELANKICPNCQTSSPALTKPAPVNESFGSSSDSAIDERFDKAFKEQSEKETCSNVTECNTVESRNYGQAVTTELARSEWKQSTRISPLRMTEFNVPPTPRKSTWQQHLAYRSNQPLRTERKQSCYVNASQYPTSPPCVDKNGIKSNAGCMSPNAAWSQLLPYRISTVPQNLSERLKKSETLPNDVWIQTQQTESVHSSDSSPNHSHTKNLSMNPTDPSKSPPPRPPLRTTSQRRFPIHPSRPSIYVNEDFSNFPIPPRMKTERIVEENPNKTRPPTQSDNVKKSAQRCSNNSSVLYRYSQLCSLPSSPKFTAAMKQVGTNPLSYHHHHQHHHPKDLVTELPRLHVERLNLGT